MFSISIFKLFEHYLSLQAHFRVSFRYIKAPFCRHIQLFYLFNMVELLVDLFTTAVYFFITSAFLTASSLVVNGISCSCIHVFKSKRRSHEARQFFSLRLLPLSALAAWRIAFKNIFQKACAPHICHRWF